MLKELAPGRAAVRAARGELRPVAARAIIQTEIPAGHQSVMGTSPTARACPPTCDAGDGGSLEFSFEARRRESANDNTPPEHAIGFRLTARFWMSGQL